MLARLEEKATLLPGMAAEFIARQGGNDGYDQILDMVNAHCQQVLNSML